VEQNSLVAWTEVERAAYLLGGQAVHARSVTTLCWRGGSARRADPTTRRVSAAGAACSGPAGQAEGAPTGVPRERPLVALAQLVEQRVVVGSHRGTGSG
jgi:hypothetical protein